MASQNYPDSTFQIGTLHAIYVSPAAGESMVQLESVRTIAAQGLDGDRYAHNTGYWQNIPKPRETIRDVSLMNLADIQNSGFTESETRRNLIVITSVNLLSLIGKKFSIGQVEFEGISDCTPCKRQSDLSGKPGFAMTFKTTGGLRARVLSEGTLKIGDTIVAPGLVQN